MQNTLSSTHDFMYDSLRSTPKVSSHASVYYNEKSDMQSPEKMVSFEMRVTSVFRNVSPPCLNDILVLFSIAYKKY